MARLEMLGLPKVALRRQSLAHPKPYRRARKALPRWGRWQPRERLTEGCPQLIEGDTPPPSLRDSPPPLAGEEFLPV